MESAEFIENSNMRQSGFTLIELSVVLVIIGLIVGAILAGRDLIDAAAQRAQLSQLDRYNTAVHAFEAKYGYLPGDIPDPKASSFGFKPRGQYQGTGNGDNIIAGTWGNVNNASSGQIQGAGETALFWVDLSTAGLIDGGFNTATAYTLPGADVTGAGINNYLPLAKIGNGNYVYVWSGGTWDSGLGAWIYNGLAYYGISAVNNIKASSDVGKPASTPAITVQQAYNMDKKIDDGYPQTGNVIAVYVTHDPIWTDGTDAVVAGETTPNTTAIQGSSSTCYDNGNMAGQQKYSLSQNGGNGMNCALSFRLQ